MRALPSPSEAPTSSVRALFEPKAVAVIGASRQPSSLGRRVLDALVAAGFHGPIYPVNAQADEIAGRRCYRRVRDLPPGVDLGVIAVPRDAVLPVVEDCIAAGVHALVVISAGFAETGAAGRALQDQIVARARAAGIRVVGPNCMGLLNTSLGLNASFSPVFPARGPVALSSQSGALGLTILELAADRGIGFSSFVSVGNKADVSSNDLLDTGSPTRIRPSSCSISSPLVTRASLASWRAGLAAANQSLRSRPAARAPACEQRAATPPPLPPPTSSSMRCSNRPA